MLGSAIATAVTLDAPPTVYVYLPDMLLSNDEYKQQIVESASQRVFPSVKGELHIKFETLPSYDESATAAAARAIEYAVEQFAAPNGPA